MQSISLTLTAPGHLDYLPVAIAFVTQSARTFGLAEQELTTVQLATEEALVNTINSLNNDATEEYSIVCRCLPTLMEVVIRDKGLPFSANEIPDYDPCLPADPDAVDGLSMYLLKHCVDEVRFHNLGRNGKETVLVKNFAAKRIDNMISQPLLEKTTEPVRLNSWKLRLFEPGNAMEISRCAYHTYGYSYEPYIYYPERVTEMNADGSLMSIVAVDEQEQLLGHAALKFHHSEDPIAELGVAFVNPAYRNNKIFGKMCRHSFQLAAKRGLFGLYGRAVTSHALSQKKTHDFGFFPSGLMLGLFPADVDFKGLTGKTIQKESALVVFMPFEAPARSIYPPPRHADIIGEIFARCATPVTIGNSNCGREMADNSPATEQTFSYSRIEVFNTADMFCYRDDLDMAKDILAAKKQLCIERTDVLFLFLDLEQPGCAALAEVCEEMGFFFAGILPFGLNGRHTLILQYLNNLAIDYSKIDLHDPFARQILDYVKACESDK